MRLERRWATRWRRPFKPLLAVSVAGAVSVRLPVFVSIFDRLVLPVLCAALVAAPVGRDAETGSGLASDTGARASAVSPW